MLRSDEGPQILFALELNKRLDMNPDIYHSLYQQPVRIFVCPYLRIDVREALIASVTSHGEIRGIRSSDVDFEVTGLYLTRTHVESFAPTPVKGTTASAKRDVPRIM